MAFHPLAGKPAPAELLIDVAKLEQAFEERRRLRTRKSDWRSCRRRALGDLAGGRCDLVQADGGR